MTQDPFAPGPVQPVNPLDDPKWDAGLLKYSDYSFFHGAAWTRVLVDTYGYTPFYFASNRSFLPLMEVNSWLTGRRGVSLPFTDVCSPLIGPGESGRPLFERMVEFGRARGWKYVECRGGREHYGDAPAALSFYGHHLGLMKDESQMFERTHDSVRRAIRKAEKNRLTVTLVQSLEGVRQFYWLQGKTRRKHGLPPQPFAFFLNIHRHILSQNLGILAIATWENRPIAASMYFYMGERAIFKYGASDESFQSLRGGNLVMWEAIKWLAQQGITSLHLGKTALAHEGLRRFKLNWGAREEKIEYIKYDLSRNQFVAGSDAVSGWHNHVFRLMPSFASRLAGALLYKHWA